MLNHGATAARSAQRLPSFRCLAYAIGGQQIGWPDDVQQALAESFSTVQQRLSVPGPWIRSAESLNRT